MRNYQLYINSQGYSIPFEKSISFPEEVVHVRDVVIFEDSPDENFIVTAVDHRTNPASLFLEKPNFADSGKEPRHMKRSNTPVASLRPSQSVTAMTAAIRPPGNVAPGDVQITCITDLVNPHVAVNIVIGTAQLQQHRNHTDGTLTIADDPSGRNSSIFRINRVVWVITPAHNRCYHGIFFLISTALESIDFEIAARNIDEFIGIYEYNELAPTFQEMFPEFQEEEEDEHFYYRPSAPLPNATEAAPAYAPPASSLMADGLPFFPSGIGRKSLSTSALQAPKGKLPKDRPSKDQGAYIQPSKSPSIPSIPKVVWMIGVPGMFYTAGSFISSWFSKKLAKWTK